MQGELQNGQDKQIFMGIKASCRACEFYLEIIICRNMINKE